MCFSTKVHKDSSRFELALGAQRDVQALLDYRSIRGYERSAGPDVMKATLGLARKPKDGTSHFRWAPEENDERVFPGYFAPVIVMKGGRRTWVPMRYRIRPAGTPKEIPSKYNLFNCRIDSLQTKPTWRRLFGKQHALFPFIKFFEWVEDSKGKKLVCFAPDRHDLMWAPALYDTWTSYDGKITFSSFSIVTDDPPPEVEEVGHDRCPVFLRNDLIDAWLTPEGRSKDELFSILKNKEEVVYHHEMAA